MKTEGIGNLNVYKDIPSPPGKPGKVFDTDVENLFKAPVDTYTPSAHIKGAADPATLDRLWKETDHMGDAVRKLIESALGNKNAHGQGFWAIRAGDFKLSEADRAHAESLIAEDGYFGVKQTTDRIMSFAKALVGEGAGEKDIENMRAAVQKGFDEVARMFGGFDKLPEVTKETHKAIMAEFDNWKAGGAAITTTE